MLDILIVGSGAICLLASIGTFSASFLVKKKTLDDNIERTKSKLRISAITLLVVSIVIFVVYYYWIKQSLLARKLLKSLQTGNPQALDTCDQYMSHKGKEVHEQFRDFVRNLKKSTKLSPKETEYQLNIF